VNKATFTYCEEDLEFIRDWAESKPSPITQRDYKRTLQQFLNFVQKNVRDCLASDLQQWLNNMKARGLSRDSLRSKAVIVKAFFSHAAALRYVEYNVMKRVKTPPAKPQAKDRILPEAKLIEVLHHPDLTTVEYLLVHTLYYTGCRISEAVNIKWSDINQNVLTVIGKGNKEREIVLPEKLLQILTEAHKQSPHKFVFTRKTGLAMDRHEASRHIKSVGAKCGIPKLSCHWFRHCHASHALERGANIKLISETLGHRSVATTSLYIHTLSDRSSGSYLA
jgi:integrase/recombinase XerD